MLYLRRIFTLDGRFYAYRIEGTHPFKLRLQMGEGVAGAAAQRGEGILVNDYAHSPYASTHGTRRLIHTAVMAAPLLYQDTLLGALTVGNEDTGRPFTPEHLQLLELFADLATLAIVLTGADRGKTT